MVLLRVRTIKLQAMAKSRASECRIVELARALCRAQPKLSKTDFEDAAASVRKNLPDYLPKMIAYKSSIQRSVLLAATPEEKEDIINSKPNTSLVEKLAELAHEAWSVTPDIESLYCAAIAVGTIIKEYGWGLQYLTPEGLCKMSGMIETQHNDAE